MNVVCPHCHEKIKLVTNENQTVASCEKCNGKFKVEMLNPDSNKSSIIPKPDEIKVLCPFCFRKVLMPESLLGEKIVCPDCENEYKVEAKHVIFTISDKRVATGTQLKAPVRVDKEDAKSKIKDGADSKNKPSVKAPSAGASKPTIKKPTETVTLAPRPDAVPIRPKGKKTFRK